jgi:hypothetical protein
MWQHPYVYLVLIFEACATFVGQLSVLCLIALFGVATTAMVGTQFFLWSVVIYSLFFLVFGFGVWQGCQGHYQFFLIEFCSLDRQNSALLGVFEC